MTTENDPQPNRLWEQLANLVAANDAGSIRSLLDDLTADDRRYAISRMAEGERTLLIDLLEPEAAAELLEELPGVQATAILEEILAGNRRGHRRRTLR